jgi:hypothetical protein
LSKHARDAVNRLHIRRVLRDHKKPAGGNHCVVRECEVSIAIEAPAADVFRRAKRIEQLDEFDIPAIRAVRGVVHDF